jgi:hypothetical protein
VTPSAQPAASYEAEAAALSGGAKVNTDHMGYTGTGFVDGYWTQGATTQFAVTAASAGSYNVTLRYGNANGTAKSVSVYVNGTKAVQTVLANLGSWDTWGTQSETLALNAGSNTITYKYDTADSGNVNLDSISVAVAGPPTPTPTAPPVTPPPIANAAYYKLMNPNSGKVLNVANSGTAENTNVNISTDNGATGQVWKITSNGDATYRLINPNSTRALDVDNAGTADGTNVLIYTDNRTLAQKWSIVPNGDGTFKLINPISNKALNVAGAGTADGTNVDVYTDNGSAGQKWKLVQLSMAAPNPTANVDVVQHHNDDSRTGANLAETILNTSNVNVNTFGKLFSKTVDGQMYAQPLYLSNFNIGGKVRNVVFAATMHNTVYAFDADDGSQSALWSKNLGQSVKLPDCNIGSCSYKDIIGEVGIVSTPYILRSNNTMYVVNMIKTAAGYEHWLHAMDLTTGEEKFGGPKKITASVPGTGDGSTNGLVLWNSQKALQRVSLSHANGSIYFGSASFGDSNPYHGWVLGYNDTTLAQELVYNTSPNGGMSGVWQAGQAFNIDANGNLIFITGNGSSSTTDNSARGESVVKMSPSGTILDWFLPYNYQYLNDTDLDFGSSGGLLIPGTNLLFAAGKEGRAYLIDTNNMGHFHAGSDSQIVQSWMAFPANLHGGPVYWQAPNGKRIYTWAEYDRLKSYNFNGNTIDQTPVGQSTMTAPNGMPGGFLSITANGSTAGSGLVWANIPYNADANQATVEGILRVFDANDVTRELWNSKMNDARDHYGNFAKFAPPTIANGKMYLGSFSNVLNVYGLQ